MVIKKITSIILAASTFATFSLAGATVEATVIKSGKGKKIYVFKYKAKKNEKKKMGHRQPYTKLQIVTIEG